MIQWQALTLSVLSLFQDWLTSKTGVAWNDVYASSEVVYNINQSVHGLPEVKNYRSQNMPMQSRSNCSDCGIFVCMVAKLWSDTHNGG